jgi:hypothetical protein
VRIRDMSFLEDLKHTIRVNFMGGTNSPTMAKYILGKKSKVGFDNAKRSAYDGDFFNTGNNLYLTTQDYLVEVNLDSTYKIYENLEMLVELGYMHLWLDQSRGVWGASRAHNVRGVSTTDALQASVTFFYSF